MNTKQSNLRAGSARVLRAASRICTPSPLACKRRFLLSGLPSPSRTATGRWKDRSIGSNSSSVPCTIAVVLPYCVIASCMFHHPLILSTKDADEPVFGGHLRRLERRLPVRGREWCPACHPSLGSGSVRPASQTLRGVSPEPIRFAQGKLRAWAQGDRHFSPLRVIFDFFVLCLVVIGPMLAARQDDGAEEGSLCHADALPFPHFQYGQEGDNNYQAGRFVFN